MNLQDKSWRALGLLGLALTAGAIRFGEDLQAPRELAFAATHPHNEVRTRRCVQHFDPAWFGDCLAPEPRLAAGR